MEMTRMERVAEVMKRYGWMPAAINVTEQAIEYLRRSKDPSEFDSWIIFRNTVADLADDEFDGYLASIAELEEMDAREDCDI